MRKQFQFTATTHHSIDRESIDYMVGNALMFGCWFHVNHCPETDNYRVITGLNEEGPNGYRWIGTPLVRFITPQDFVAAIPKAAEYLGCRVEDIIDGGSRHDCVSDDAVLQIAALGEVVYG